MMPEQVDSGAKHCPEKQAEKKTIENAAGDGERMLFIRT
jgi:hypothetical protein